MIFLQKKQKVVHLSGALLPYTVVYTAFGGRFKATRKGDPVLFWRRQDYKLACVRNKAGVRQERCTDVVTIHALTTSS